jgi:acylphosphatase
MTKRIHVVVTGRVQNVGFRAFVQRRASELGLAGWVRNMENRRHLELEAEGDEHAIDQLIVALRRGPSAAIIESIALGDREITHQPASGFQVR